MVRWRSLLDLLFKSECSLCGRDSREPICDRCRPNLERLAHRNRERLWRLSPPTFVWGQYRGDLKRAIAAMKYSNRPQIGEYLGTRLGRAWMASAQRRKVGQVIVVPLPMHPKKRRDRGFDQAEEIARGFCEVTGAPLVERGLERVRATRALFDLSPDERRRELARAFRVGPARERLLQLDRPILLVDDIFTTGATAKAGKAALDAARLPVAGLAAIATTAQ
ncbi:MAG: ComF family protein [Geitlerinemataceae cyanobacterium]